MFFIAFLGTATAEPNLSKRPLASARVVVAEQVGATEMFVPRPEVVPELFQKGLLHFTNRKDETDAWLSLVSTNDVIGIKVFASPGSNSGTRPAVVEALIESLIRSKVPPKQIIVWDKNYSDLRNAGFAGFQHKFGVQVMETRELGWDENAFYETSIIGTPVWGDLEFGKKGEEIGRKSYVAKLITQKITKIISVAPLLNHNLTGVTGHLYSLSLGSVDNAIRFDYRRARLETAVPEIAGLPEIFDRVVLNITDALICQYQGEQKTLLHYSSALNQLWFSKDPVALDTLSISELEQQRKLAGKFVTEFKTEIYTNAALLELGVADLKRITVDPAK